jgi:hypothetical protein
MSITVSSLYLQAINGKEIDVYLRKRCQSALVNACAAWTTKTPASMSAWISGDTTRGQIIVVTGSGGNRYGVEWIPTTAAATHASTGATEPIWATAITRVTDLVVDGSGSWVCKWTESQVRAALIWFANQAISYPDNAVNRALDVFQIDFGMNGVNSKWRPDTLGNTIDDADWAGLINKLAWAFAAITLNY